MRKKAVPTASVIFALWLTPCIGLAQIPEISAPEDHPKSYNHRVDCPLGETAQKQRAIYTDGAAQRKAAKRYAEVQAAEAGARAVRKAKAYTDRVAETQRKAANRYAKAQAAAAGSKALRDAKAYTDRVADTLREADKRYAEDMETTVADAEGNARGYTDAAEKRTYNRVTHAQTRISTMQKQVDLGGWALLAAIIAMLLAIVAYLQAKGIVVRIPHPFKSSAKIPQPPA